MNVSSVYEDANIFTSLGTPDKLHCNYSWCIALESHIPLQESHLWMVQLPLFP
jgi:hypothetical protein